MPPRFFCQATDDGKPDLKYQCVTKEEVAAEEASDAWRAARYDVEANIRRHKQAQAAFKHGLLGGTLGHGLAAGPGKGGFGGALGDLAAAAVGAAAAALRGGEATAATGASSPSAHHDRSDRSDRSDRDRVGSHGDRGAGPLGGTFGSGDRPLASAHAGGGQASRGYHAKGDRGGFEGFAFGNTEHHAAKFNLP